MRIRWSALLFSSFVVMISWAASARTDLPAQGWESLGPPGGDVADLVSVPGHPARVYAVVKSEPGQLYASEDSGQNWTKTATFEEPVYSMALDPWNPEVMYVLGKEAVMKTVDGGATWTRSAFGDYWYGEGGKIVVHPLDPQLVIATGYHCYLAPASGVSGVAFFKSVDGGGSWASACLDVTRPCGQGLAMAVNPFDTGEYYIAGYEGDSSTLFGKVYRTGDGGATWTDITGPWDHVVEDIVLDPIFPATVFVATSRHVYKSVDSGLNWMPVLSGLLHTLAWNTIDPNVLYAAGEGAFYRTTNGGADWVPFSLSAGACQAFLAQGSELLYGTSSSIIRSANGGTYWGLSQDGLNASTVKSVLIAPGSLRMLYGVVGDSIVRSDNSGDDLQLLTNIFEPGSLGQVVVHPLDSSILYAVGRCYG